MRFVTAAELVTMLVEAQQEGRLARKLAQLARFDVVIADELGYSRDPHPSGSRTAVLEGLQLQVEDVFNEAGRRASTACGSIEPLR